MKYHIYLMTLTLASCQTPEFNPKLTSNEKSYLSYRRIISGIKKLRTINHRPYGNLSVKFFRYYDKYPLFRQRFFRSNPLFMNPNRFLFAQEPLKVNNNTPNQYFTHDQILKVDQIIDEANNVISLYLKPKDSKQALHFIPGQYIPVSIYSRSLSKFITRFYSISNTPLEDYIRITLKINTNNHHKSFSQELNDNIKVGGQIIAGKPRGAFVHSNTDNPTVLIAGGLGITPLISIFKQIHKTNQTLFINCTKNSESEIFRNELLELKNKNSKIVTIFDSPLSSDKIGINYDFNGFLTYDLIKELKFKDKSSEFYICGPEVFQDTVIKYLLEMGIQESKINFESFSNR